MLCYNCEPTFMLQYLAWWCMTVRALLVFHSQQENHVLREARVGKSKEALDPVSDL